MCEHCKDAGEDREVVHNFMQRAAARLTVIHSRTIDPDDIEVSFTISNEAPGHEVGLDGAVIAVHRLLAEAFE